jgi:hypothetical protein
MSEDKLITTTKLPDFEMKDYNRDKISLPHAKTIARSMERLGKNWIPVIVSKDGIILDGQHRYLAFKMLQEKGCKNVKFIYILSNLLYEEAEDECRDVISTVNSETNKWRMADWIEFHSYNNENYKQLQDLQAIYSDFHVSALASLCHEGAPSGGGITNVVRAGEFEYNFNKQKEYILDEITKLAAVNDAFTQKAFLVAVILLSRQEQFKAKRLFDKINENLGTLQKQSGQDNWMGYLAHMYNKHMRNKHDMLKVTVKSY